MTNLLLHLFVITFPIHGYQIYMNTRYYSLQITSRKNRLVIGILLALSGMLSIKYPILYMTDSFRWDLRMIPLILSFTFGGSLGGWTCFGFMTAFRLIRGGEAMMYGITVHLLVALLAWFIGRNFYRKPLREKQLIVIWAAIFGFTAKTVAMLVYFQYHLSLDLITLHNMKLLGYVFILHIISTWSLTLWLDQMINTYFMRDRLQRAEQLHLLSEMAASVAHEVRNPLQVTKGYLQLNIKRTEDPIRSQLQTALNEIDRASSIISEYLSFAKPKLEEITLIYVEEQLALVESMMLPLANQEGVTLSFTSKGPLYFHGDPNKFKQIMINLVKNSIEASNGKGDILVEARSDEHEIVIQVKDNGEGMTEDEIRQLGTPFYSTKSKGTGLGLMVTFRLVEVMNGRLHFTSKKGEGTKAALSFPAVHSA